MIQARESENAMKHSSVTTARLTAATIALACRVPVIVLIRERRERWCVVSRDAKRAGSRKMDSTSSCVSRAELNWRCFLIRKRD